MLTSAAVSRRSASPQDDRRWVFNRLAAAYRHRPGYPTALLDRLLSLGGGAGARVAELGAGTGHLALPLARLGARVVAVEPARAMLEALRAAEVPGLEAVHAAAEETGLPAGAFDLLVLADTLQWVDPDRAGREAARLLAPGGALAVVTPRLAATPFLAALAERIARANPKARPAPPPVGLLFSVAGLPAPVEERFEDEVRLDEAGLEGVLRSLSYVGPALGPAALEALLLDARALAAEHGGALWRRRSSSGRRGCRPPLRAAGEERPGTLRFAKSASAGCWRPAATLPAAGAPPASSPPPPAAARARRRAAGGWPGRGGGRGTRCALHVSAGSKPRASLCSPPAPPSNRSRPRRMHSSSEWYIATLKCRNGCCSRHPQ